MSDALVLVLLAAFGGLLIMGLGLFAFARFADHGAGAPVPVAFREAGGAWRKGRLRVDGDVLDLRASGPAPSGPWLRGHLDLGIAGPMSDQDALEVGRPGMIVVPVTYGTSTFELALDEQNYTALRAWVEAMPPGWNSQVA